MEEKIGEFFKKDIFAARNGIHLLENRPGYAKAHLKVTPEHYNAAGVVQGGALFTLADFAFAVAVNSYGNTALSIQSNISFYKSTTAGELTAVAKELSKSRKLANYQVEIYNDSNELIAMFNGTAYITDKFNKF